MESGRSPGGFGYTYKGFSMLSSVVGRSCLRSRLLAGVALSILLGLSAVHAESFPAHTAFDEPVPGSQTAADVAPPAAPADAAPLPPVVAVTPAEEPAAPGAAAAAETMPETAPAEAGGLAPATAESAPEVPAPAPVLATGVPETPAVPSVAVVTPLFQDVFTRNFPESAQNKQTIAGGVNRFYRQRDQSPVWVNDNGPSAAAATVLGVLERATGEGLNPADYLVDELRTLAAENTPRARVAFELLMSEATLRYALDMQGYRIIGLQPNGNFALSMPDAKFENVLARIAEAKDPAAQLAALTPASAFYTRLRGQLAVYRQLDAQGVTWSPIDSGSTLEPGMRDARVAVLRARLTAGGARLRPPGDEPRLYSGDMVEAVKQFQASVGLTPDGKVGEKTRTALNHTVRERLEQIALGLDWLRTLPRDSAPLILINIPEFRVRAMEGDTEALAMNAIIGRPVRPTPILRSKVTQVIYNPSWTVPHKLAREDKLPILRTRPESLVEQGFHVYRNTANGRDEVDPMTVDWNRVTKENFPYWMRQDPGPRNALGAVRLTFQNPFDVYMHDTPDRHLFQQDVRALSSGCIRLERPFDMVEYVLKSNPGMDRAAIDASSQKRGTHAQNVERSVTVQTVYMTAIVAPDGALQLREDLYGLDRYFLDAQKKRTETIAADRAQQTRRLASAR